MFERDEVQLGASAQGGNNGTGGGEVVLSAIHGKLSASIGGFHYETDGWRDNNAQDQDIGNLFLQYAATPAVNLQAEITDRSSSEAMISEGVCWMPNRFRAIARWPCDCRTLSFNQYFRAWPIQ